MFLNVSHSTGEFVVWGTGWKFWWNLSEASWLATDIVFAWTRVQFSSLWKIKVKIIILFFGCFYDRGRVGRIGSRTHWKLLLLYPWGEMSWTAWGVPVMVIGVLALAIAALLAYLSWSSLKLVSIPLKGRHVVITGGSSGIGLEVAKLAAAEGARISLVARDLSKLADAKSIVTEYCRQNLQGEEKVCLGGCTVVSLLVCIISFQVKDVWLCLVRFWCTYPESNVTSGISQMYSLGSLWIGDTFCNWNWASPMFYYSENECYDNDLVGCELGKFWQVDFVKSYPQALLHIFIVLQNSGHF